MLCVGCVHDVDACDCVWLSPRKAACMCVCNTLYMHVCVHARVQMCVRAWNVRGRERRHAFICMVGFVLYAYNHAQ